MNYAFNKGIAFVFEGDTEEEFYRCLLYYICGKYGLRVLDYIDKYNNEPSYIIEKEKTIILVKYYTVGTIPNLAKSATWFKTQCSDRYSVASWTMFLCYDTDDYKEKVSRFQQGDWARIKKKFKKAKVIELAASADIEDIMLIDVQGICNFLEIDVSDFPRNLPGAKGKRKIQSLFRAFGTVYHEGERASALISTLDMQLLIDKAPLLLKELENCIAG